MIERILPRKVFFLSVTCWNSIQDSVDPGVIANPIFSEYSLEHFCIITCFRRSSALQSSCFARQGRYTSVDRSLLLFGFDFQFSPLFQVALNAFTIGDDQRHHIDRSDCIHIKLLIH